MRHVTLQVATMPRKPLPEPLVAKIQQHLNDGKSHRKTQKMLVKQGDYASLGAIANVANGRKHLVRNQDRVPYADRKPGGPKSVVTLKKLELLKKMALKPHAKPQKVMAKRVGISQSYVSKIINKTLMMSRKVHPLAPATSEAPHVRS